MVAFRSGSDVELINYMGNDQLIADAARTSTKGERGRAYDGLIRAMVRDKHGSVFEFGSVVFRVYTPQFVRDHMVRHRSGVSFAIQSQRYTEVLADTAEFWLPEDSRPLAQEGHPMAYNLQHDSDTIHAQKLAMVTGSLMRASTDAMLRYEDMVSTGIPREVARSVLPSNLYGAMYVQFNPRSLMHFLSLRATTPNSSHPQLETAQVADQMFEFAEAIWPTTMEWFAQYGMETP